MKDDRAQKIINDIIDIIGREEIVSGDEFRSKYPSIYSRMFSYGLTWDKDIQPAYKEKHGQYLTNPRRGVWKLYTSEEVWDIVAYYFEENHFQAFADYRNWYENMDKSDVWQVPSPTYLMHRFHVNTKQMESILSEKLGRPIDKSLRGKVNL